MERIVRKNTLAVTNAIISRQTILRWFRVTISHPDGDEKRTALISANGSASRVYFRVSSLQRNFFRGQNMSYDARQPISRLMTRADAIDYLQTNEQQFKKLLDAGYFPQPIQIGFSIERWRCRDLFVWEQLSEQSRIKIRNIHRRKKQNEKGKKCRNSSPQSQILQAERPLATSSI